MAVAEDDRVGLAGSGRACAPAAPCAGPASWTTATDAPPSSTSSASGSRSRRAGSSTLPWTACTTGQRASSSSSTEAAKKSPAWISASASETSSRQRAGQAAFALRGIWVSAMIAIKAGLDSDAGEEKRPARRAGRRKGQARRVRGQARLRGDAGAGAETPTAQEGRAALRRPGTQRPPPALGPAPRARRASPPPGRSPTASPPTPTRTAWRSTPRTTRSSTSTSRARSRPGNYGAGTMRIWDRGTYEAEKWEDGKARRQLRRRAACAAATRSSAPAREKDWMIHRMDPPDEERDPFPEGVVPMLAKLAQLPRERRGLGGRGEVGRGAGDRLLPARAGVELQTRNLNDVTAQYPEVRRLGAPARRPRRGPRRRAGRLRRGRPAQLRAPPAAHPPDRRRPSSGGG